MKRILFTALILMMAFTVVYAQDAGSFTVGARGGIGLGFNDLPSDLKVDGWDDDINLKSLLHPVVAAYGFYTFMPNMAVQLELNLMFNQGLRSVNKDDENIYGDLSYRSLDIPVMFMYTFLNEPVTVGVAAGPYISIPIGKLNTKVVVGDDSVTVENDIDGFGFGAAVGFFVAYPLGPGSLIGDVRFIMDFMHPKSSVTEEPFMNRRALNVSVGYQFTF